MVPFYSIFRVRAPLSCRTLQVLQTSNFRNQCLQLLPHLHLKQIHQPPEAVLYLLIQLHQGKHADHQATNSVGRSLTAGYHLCNPVMRTALLKEENPLCSLSAAMTCPQEVLMVGLLMAGPCVPSLSLWLLQTERDCRLTVITLISLAAN